MLENLVKLKPNIAVTVVLTTCCTLSPGCLFVYTYKEALFLNLEISKLLLLSLSITGPVLAGSFIYVLLRIAAKGTSLPAILLLSSFMACLIISVLIAVRILDPEMVDTKQKFFRSVAALAIGLLFGLEAENLVDKFRKRKKQRTSSLDREKAAIEE